MLCVPEPNDHEEVAAVFTRVFNDARREQGFVSQAHLDAFFACRDHVAGCATCQSPGAPMPLDDGMQPTAAACAEEQQLLVASFRENFEAVV